MALIDDVKAACRVTVDSYNGEFADLIAAAFADIGITDVKTALLVETDPDPLIKRAVVTYCKMNFGYLDTAQYDKFKASYDEQKAQLLMASGYTDWGADDA